MLCSEHTMKSANRRDKGAPKRPSSKRNCILIVDDEPAMRLILNKRLTKHSFRVIEASDGPSCLAMARKMRPDLILLDILLPGEDGTLTYDALKENPKTKAIPVVFLSGLAKDFIHTREDGMGGRYFILGKPFSPRQLLRIIRKAMKG